MGNLISPEFLVEAFPQILSKLPLTLVLTAVSTLSGWLVGLLVAVVRIRKTPFLQGVCTVYISVIRGTPLLAQIYLTYYGIPILIRIFNLATGYPDWVTPNWDSTVFGILALALNCGAYSSETIRAALLSVDRGQIEAAHAIGLTNTQALRRIIIPQAVVVAIPTLSSSLMNMLHATSLLFTIAVVDIMAQARLVGANGYRYFEVFLDVAVIYWVLCFVIERVTKRLERRFAVPGMTASL
jgi:His/Glu/Gln/Arg/opine family amino acid ABC transporter permease subunit